MNHIFKTIGTHSKGGVTRFPGDSTTITTQQRRQHRLGRRLPFTAFRSFFPVISLLPPSRKILPWRSDFHHGVSIRKIVAKVMKTRRRTTCYPLGLSAFEFAMGRGIGYPYCFSAFFFPRWNFSFSIATYVRHSVCRSVGPYFSPDTFVKSISYRVRRRTGEEGGGGYHPRLI